MKNSVLKKLIYCITHIEEWISAVGIAIMVCATGYNVFARYVLRSPTSWSDEISIIALAYVTFLGSAAVYKNNGHYGMDFLVERLPDGAKMFVRRAINLVLIVLFAYVTYLGWDFTIHSVKVFQHTRLPYQYMNAALPMGFLSMTIYSVYYFVLSFVWPEKYRARYDNCYDDVEAKS